MNCNEDGQSKNCCLACEQPASFGEFCVYCGLYKSNDLSNQTPPSTLIMDSIEDRLTVVRPWKSAWPKPFQPLTFLGIGLALLFIGVRQESVVSMVPLIGFGFILFLNGLVCAINKTHVEISKDHLQVKRGPIPVPLLGSFSIRHSEIKKITLVKRESPGEGDTIEYTVNVVNRHNEPLQILQFKKADEGIQFFNFLQTYYQLGKQRSAP